VLDQLIIKVKELVVLVKRVEPEMERLLLVVLVRTVWQGTGKLMSLVGLLELVALLRLRCHNLRSCQMNYRDDDDVRDPHAHDDDDGDDDRHLSDVRAFCSAMILSSDRRHLGSGSKCDAP